MGAAYLSKGQYEYIPKAEDNLLIALELLKHNHFSPLYYKELFYNLIRLYLGQRRQQDINNLLMQWNFKEINEFYQFFSASVNSEDHEYGVMCHQNVNFIF